MNLYNSTFKVPRNPTTSKTKPKPAPWKRAAAPRSPKVRPPMKSRGMKGMSVTAEQKRFWDMLCQHIGCIASRQDGFFDPVCSIHHIDGRTKPDSHWLVLPLSAGNHQDGTGAPGRIAVHPWKARFEEKYGTQECIRILQKLGCDVPQAAVIAVGIREGAQ